MRRSRVLAECRAWHRTGPGGPVQKSVRRIFRTAKNPSGVVTGFFAQKILSRSGAPARRPDGFFFAGRLAGVVTGFFFRRAGRRGVVTGFLFGGVTGFFDPEWWSWWILKHFLKEIPMCWPGPGVPTPGSEGRLVTPGQDVGWTDFFRSRPNKNPVTLRSPGGEAGRISFSRAGRPGS